MSTPNGHGPTANNEREECAGLVSVTALARTVQVLERRVAEQDALGRRVDELGAMLTRLAQQVTATKGNSGPSMVAAASLSRVHQLRIPQRFAAPRPHHRRSHEASRASRHGVCPSSGV